MIAEFDPIALDLGFIAVHWYGLAYMAGFLGALFWAKWVLKHWARQGQHFGVKAFHLDDVMTIAIVGVVVGGRLGEVILYHPQYYFAHPWDIVKIWQGGMSFHGGVIGVVLGLWWFCRRQKVSFRALGDMVCIGIPIGIFFGRIANFINGELWGRPIADQTAVSSTVPWAVIVPGSGSMEWRHPSPIYEALLEGLLLFVVLAAVAKLGGLRYRGVIAGMFLAGYALARSIAEFFRAPEVLEDQLWWGTSWGQWLSLPLLVVGVMLIWRGLGTTPPNSPTPTQQPH